MSENDRGRFGGGSGAVRERFGLAPAAAAELCSYPMRRAAKSWGLFGVAAALWACPAKEAEDPGKILGDWSEHHGVEGTEGAQGAREPRSVRTAEPPKQVATKLECDAASRRIEELALELAVSEAEDPAERAKLDARRKQEIASAGFKARIEHASKECLARETTSAEARCIARAKSEMDIERCGEH